MFTVNLAFRLRISLPSEYAGLAWWLLRNLHPLDIDYRLPFASGTVSETDRVVGFATAGG
jgi:hypothetical protein